ncbi:MAG: radical SAM protein [candidate division WWE3 bacterium]|nr:radical SAM protein [candidate division WWE3 bacterium]
MQYRLRDGVYLVTGALRGAILDTGTEKVYSVNEQAVATLQYQVANEAYWLQLVSLDLAEVTEAARVNFLPEVVATRPEFVWFEITEDCNERCIHCYAGCSDPKTKALPKLTHLDWLRLVREAYEVGFRRCQFIGGEPFNYKGPKGETVLDLAEYAVQLGFEMVELFTNALLISKPATIARVKDLRLHVATSLYSSDPSVHDGITRIKGSQARTVQSLHLLHKAGVQTRVGIVVMRQNEHTIKETVALAKSLGASTKRPDILRPTGRGDDKSLLPSKTTFLEYAAQTSPNFKARSAILLHNRSGNACLQGKLAVTPSGEVYPCVFARDQVLGDVSAEGSLQEITNADQTRLVWESTKDSVLVCKDCEYRYVCNDCRPLAYAAANEQASFISAPPPRCGYNPYTGTWRGEF